MDKKVKLEIFCPEYAAGLAFQKSDSDIIIVSQSRPLPNFEKEKFCHLFTVSEEVVQALSKVKWATEIKSAPARMSKPTPHITCFSVEKGMDIKNILDTLSRIFGDITIDLK